MNDRINRTDNIDPSVGGTLFQRFFTGKTTASEVAPKTFFMTADYVNVAAIETEQGLVMVDTGMKEAGPKVYEAIRGMTDAPLHTVIFTHGHLDHAFGLGQWLDAGERPRVIAHENLPRRFRTYMKTAPMNVHVNQVQFGIEREIYWPEKSGDFFWPDTVYRESLTLRIGGETFELYHGKGETDDATWVWAKDRNIVCSGDLWLSILPNCGNPQKVQRYPEEWADALEKIATTGAEILLPGHGHPLEGREIIRERCLNTAGALREIVNQTLKGLNAGKTHEEIISSIKMPEHLAGEPCLDPLYDRPEFIARNVLRKYGGWWDGHPASVLPAMEERKAREIAGLAGGVRALVSRARELAVSEPELACHLAEWAAMADPDDPETHWCVIEVFSGRAEKEISLMARGIFSHAVRKAEAALARLEGGK